MPCYAYHAAYPIIVISWGLALFRVWTTNFPFKRLARRAKPEVQ